MLTVTARSRRSLLPHSRYHKTPSPPSAGNVLFPDVNSTKRALVGRGTPLPPDVVAQPQAEQAAAAEAAAAAETVRPGDPVPAPPPVRYQPELPVPDNLADVANIPYLWVKVGVMK